MRPHMALLGVLGLWSLALGGLSGWLMAAVIDKPGVVARLGIRHPARVRQVHLDWILMGLLLLAVHVAVPERPDWITALIAFGTVVNPLLFIPLAYRSDAAESLAYRTITGSSFVALSTGLVALAIDATL